MFKLLTLDIETSPIDAYTWGIWQQNVNLNGGVKSPNRILSWAAKWEHEDETLFSSEWDHGQEDMIRMVYELVDEADAIIGYNSKGFDMKHLNREFIRQGFGPPSPYTNIDLLHKVKANFNFPSNKLDYVAGALGLGSKLENPGMPLWVGVLNGDKKCQQLMEDYNIQDVILTEQLYNHIQGWIGQHPNRALWLDPAPKGKHICPNCGGQHLYVKGYKRTRVLSYVQYQCQDCGSYPRERFRTIESKGRKDVLT